MNPNIKLKIMKEHILQAAYAKHLLTPEQYKEKYQGKYLDQYGSDSFMIILSHLIKHYGEEGNIFLTFCKPMLKDKKKFKEIFDVEIVSPNEMVKRLEK